MERRTRLFLSFILAVAFFSCWCVCLCLARWYLLRLFSASYFDPPPESAPAASILTLLHKKAASLHTHTHTKKDPLKSLEMDTREISECPAFAHTLARAYIRDRRRQRRRRGREFRRRRGREGLNSALFRLFLSFILYFRQRVFLISDFRRLFEKENCRFAKLQ